MFLLFIFGMGVGGVSKPQLTTGSLVCILFSFCLDRLLIFCEWKVKNSAEKTAREKLACLLGLVRWTQSRKKRTNYQVPTDTSRKSEKVRLWRLMQQKNVLTVSRRTKGAAKTNKKKFEETKTHFFLLSSARKTSTFISAWATADRMFENIEQKKLHGKKAF